MSESACPQDPNRVKTKAPCDPVCRWTIVDVVPVALQIASAERHRSGPKPRDSRGTLRYIAVNCTTRRVYDGTMSAEAR